MTIYKEFTFDLAQFLPQVPHGHKCRLDQVIKSIVGNSSEVVPVDLTNGL